MWFKGDLASEKLETLIDSELLIYCLQADYILSHIRICIVKTLFSLRFTPLLLSTMYVTSPSLVMLLCTVVVTSCLSVAIVVYHCYDSTVTGHIVVVCVHVSTVCCQSAAFSAVCCQSAVISDQWFSLQTPPVTSPQTSRSLSVCACLDDSLFHCLGNKLFWHLSGAYFIVGLPWVLLLSVLVSPCDCALENEWVFPSHAVT
jgi:hypothetical protein